MIDITAFSKRIRRRSMIAGALFFGSALMLVLDFTTNFPTAERAKGEFAIVWFFLMAVGGYFYIRSLELPSKEILQLAQSKNGLLTLSEITVALNISPDVALRALRHLNQQGLARSRWEEFEKNLWEFPDAAPPTSLPPNDSPPPSSLPPTSNN